MEDSSRMDTRERMRELIEHLAGDLEAEANFDPDDWASTWADDDSPRDGLDEVPTDIRERIDMAYFEDDPESAVSDAYGQWRDEATDSVLDVRGSVTFISDGVELDSLTMVLGTGGPHVEVTLDQYGRGFVRAYDWFLEGDNRRSIDIGSHPLVELFELYAETVGR